MTSIIQSVQRFFLKIFIVSSVFLSGILTHASLDKDKAKPTVLVSFSLLSQIVTEIVPPGIEVLTLVPSGQDVHHFDWTPRHLKDLSRSRVLIINGLGFETWIVPFMQAAHFKGTLIEAARTITPLKMGSRPDPHAWMDPRNVLVYVDQIKNGLIQEFPNYQNEIESRSGSYKKQIQQLIDELPKKAASLPESKKKIFVSHNSFSYFGRFHNLTFYSFAHSHEQASAQDIKNALEDIKKHQISLIFREPHTPEGSLKNVAKETGLKVQGVLLSDSLNENASTYIDMMKYNLRQLELAR